LLAGHLRVRTDVDEPARIGFIVSRAVGQAVVRNKVKRRMRHLAAGYLHSLPRGSLLVLRANPQAATARQAELAAELDVVVRTLLRRQGGAV
jgi:ribonuclease P protein component